MKMFLVALASVGLLALGSARADIVNTPLPVLPGSGDSVSVVYAATGVYNTEQMATAFHCTYLWDGCADVGLEVFDFAGKRLNNPAGGTAIKKSAKATLSRS